jgi:hypothetical protein
VIQGDRLAGTADVRTEKGECNGPHAELFQYDLQAGELPVSLHYLRVQSEMLSRQFISRKPDHDVDHRARLHGALRRPHQR